MNFESIYLLDIQWQDVKHFFNSVFFTAIAGSLAGAFAGAYGAQRIAERAKHRDELLREIRNTNTATVVAFGLCNSFIQMKKQHVKPLKETFDSQKAAFLDHLNKMRAGQINKDTAFAFLADFETLPPPQLPVDILQKQVFEKLSLVGRPLNLIITLGQVTHGLIASLEQRNQLIESHKLADTPISAPLYFGLLQGNCINQEYSSLIDAIYNQTDHGIFFSHLLGKDLIEHGEQAAAQFKNTYGKGAPSISKSDFSEAEKAGLMPNADNYPDWFAKFAKSTGSPTFLEKIRLLLKRH